ncbi:MAG: dihydroorotase [Bacteroidota bacterium]|nr:dihydroorotase [Bacteroidota bacterium]MDP4234472.1 dihydroorotase [Bacteroidota bacterium]MDP4244180.1 dihydroorotase [Bacteroidota bacterium]MDP4288821.1 dihydroorotase [Bacteroidota bacterium]
MNLLLKNARLIDPSQNRDETGLDIEIRDGKIARIGKGLKSDFDARDLKGAVVAPGFCDMHVHLREPGQEHKETIQSGLNAAMSGGFTAICCMPNTEPPVSDPFVVSFIKEKARGHLVDLAICGTMTKARKGEELAPIASLAEAGVRMISDDGSAVSNAMVMRRVFEYAKMFDLLVTQHCEEHTLTASAPINEGKISTKLGLTGWPSVAEEIIIARDILLAEYVGGVRYHAAHVSTAGSVRLIREAKARGAKVSCEVTPHHFTLTDESIETYGTQAKMNPPLRTQEDINAIIAGLRDGTIDAISTDHAPHAAHDKETDIVSAAFGIIGLETAIPIGLTQLVATGHLTLSEYIVRCSTNPRGLLGLPAIRILEGEPASMTIFAPDDRWRFAESDIRSKSHNTPFVGSEFTGRVIGTLNNGQAFWSRN